MSTLNAKYVEKNQFDDTNIVITGKTNSIIFHNSLDIK